ncbi:hypothetical protein MBH78_12050 [Oceanimonas sp. NS1]|nr:hypothetical protein [Oceanimonas sp. NS1]
MSQHDTQPGGEQDQYQQIDMDPGVIMERLDSWLDGAVRLVPNIVVALLVLALFYGLAVMVRRMVLAHARRRERENLGRCWEALSNGPWCCWGFCWRRPLSFPA